MVRCGTWELGAEYDPDPLNAEFEAEVQMFVCTPPRAREHLRKRLARGLPGDLCADVNAAFDEAMRRSRVPTRSRRLPASMGAAHAPRGRREARPRKAASSAAKQAVDEPPPHPAEGGPATTIASAEAAASAEGLTAAERRFLSSYAELAVERMLAALAAADDDQGGTGGTS